MKRRYRLKVPVVALLVLAGLLGVSMPAQAEWMLNSGCTGHVESGPVFAAWGRWYNQGNLTCGLAAGTQGAVNFAIPTRFVSSTTPGVTKIRFRAGTGYGGVITKVYVYDGSDFVTSFDGPWSGAMTTIILTLPEKRVCKYGLSLIFDLKNDTSGNVIFLFSSVGGNFL
jgi:hypothetical protein